MEDLNQIQEQLNSEFKQKKRDELRTPEGFKKAVGEQAGAFVSKLLMRKQYQAVFGIILAYILGFGLWSVFSYLFSWNTVIVVGLCLLAVYWIQIKSIVYKLKSTVSHFWFRLETRTEILRIKLRLNKDCIKAVIYGFFKRKTK